MKRKNLIILISAIVIVAAGLTIYLTTSGSTNGDTVTENKQLYTCGMHPDIISEEPGDCPICGMKLVPKKGTGTAKNDGERKILYWVAPMDPNEIYDEPGKSKMGMDLVPVYEDEVAGGSVVKIDPVVEQNMNVKTETVKARELSSTVTTNGVLTTDETKEYIVNTRVNGWVENLFVDYTGKVVNKGQKLMDIYSPELVAAQQEYLTALSYQNTVDNSRFTNVKESGSKLVKNAENKLRLLEIPQSYINRLKETGEIQTYVTLYAQKSGTVLHKNVVEGEKINAGQSLLKIANLSTLWLIADIYEYELPKIRLGSEANISFTSFPGKKYSGKITFIYPTLDSKTRTIKIRIEIPNRNGELKPDMYANVIIHGKELGLEPVIPEQAIIRTGEKDVVIVSLGEGRFKPQEIKLGNYSNGYYQVLDGLTEGMKIVTSAQFLIDSESNLKAAVNKFTSETSSDTTGNNDEMSNMDMGSNDKKMEMKKDGNEQPEMQDNPIIRKGIIDLESIDKNNDGKVYQDVMDWNVISDEPGRCPICNMELKEVSLDEARKNLVEHGFKVKNKPENNEKESIVREGVIDLKPIDKNHDGKVFQDMMDWNVISDKPGECPLCGMEMKEVSVHEAERNLIENGFKVK